MLAASSATAYNIVYIVLGVGAAVWEGGRITRAWRDKYRKKRQIERERDEKLDALLKKVSVNGRDTNELGDVAKRTEDKTDESLELLKQHIEHSDAAEADIYRRLYALENK